MPKAKRIRNVRLTKPKPYRKKRRERQDGRPRGTLKKFKFEETKLGFMLRHETPVVFNILMNSLPSSPFPEPSPELIQAICRASRDPSFKKPKFKRYLEDYSRTGLFCKRGKYLTPEREIYYTGIRAKKMNKFIQKNKERIERMKE